MEFKRVTPRVNVKAIEVIDRYFSSTNAGIENQVNNFDYLFRITLEEINGMFTENELLFAIEAMENVGAILMGGKLLPVHIKAAGVDKLDEKWSVVTQDVLNKLESLTGYQLHVLEVWCAGYWKGKTGRKKLNDYVKDLTYGCRNV
jgi:phage-related protein